MKTKKTDTQLKKLASSDEFHIKQTGTGVFIEGFANKATVDRGNEIIATDAWELDNFKKNPIILFNHGMDTLGGTPIGKATAIEQTDKGLFIKVRMSASQSPGIKMVRDLVEERILKAFSVGFDPKEVENVDMDGKSIKKITKAELFEVSIVGVPMNQDSTFELSEKALTTKSLHQIKTEFLAAKGAKDALRIEKHFVDKFDRTTVIHMVSDQTDVDTEELKEMMAGDKQVTLAVKSAFASILGFKAEVSMEDEEEDDEEDESGKGSDESAEAQSEEEKKPDEDEEESKPEEKKGGSDEEEDPPAASAKADFQDCVASKIPKLLDEGKERDEAVAQAISMCQEDGKCSLSPEAKTAAFEACFNALDSWDGENTADLKFDFPEAVVLTTAQSETKQAGEGDTTAIDSDAKNGEDNFGSPFLEAAKQTNVLLGTLIGEIQGLRKEVAEMKAPAPPAENVDSQSQESQNSSDADGIKDVSVDYAKKRLENLNQRLKNLGC